MSTAPADTQQQHPQQTQAQAADKVKGETWSAYAHFGFSLAFFLAAVIVVVYTHSHDIGKNLDFVRLYRYSKPVYSKDDVGNDIVQYLKANAWINDATDNENCLDMSTFWWPTYSWASGNNPASDTCVFTVNLEQGPMEGQLKIKDVTKTTVSGCVAGTYTPVWATSGSGTVTSSPSITIDNAKEFTFQSSVIGYDFWAYNAKFLACQNKRRALTQLVHEKTGCQYGLSSPMCTCVRAFTQRFDLWGTKLNAKPQGKMLLGDVLSEGVKRCIQLRRTHDQREEVDKVYARSSALIIFAVALLFNGALNVLQRYKLFNDMIWAQVAFFVLYFVAVLVTGLVDGDAGAEVETVLALCLPAFLVHGTYLVLLYSYFKAQVDACPPPFLHPVTFDICLSALNLFTLTERGVVQLEYLIAEVLKGHAVAAIYIGVVWYHRYGGDREILSSEFVQSAYVVMYASGLLASGSGMIVPYPAKKCFELHWLLPLAFTYAAFSTACWHRHLKLSTVLNSQGGIVLHNYNSVTGFVVLTVAVVFWSYFLSEHIQVYGSKHFAYPSGGDPQSYVAVRDKLLPVSGLLVPRVSQM